MVAEFGQQQWSCTNFRCSDRTLRSPDNIFDFSQEIVKICVAAWIWTPAEILTSRVGTTSRYSTGETQPIKAEQPEPSDHVRSTCLRINTIYEGLNESSSARPGGSQQWKILPSLNSKRTPNFSTQILTRRRNFTRHRNFTRRGDFNVSHSSIARLNFTRRINSVHPPKFSAAIFRSNFLQQFSVSNFPPEFSPRILGIRHNFHETQKFHVFVIF
jgi:hypothetical protein